MKNSQVTAIKMAGVVLSLVLLPVTLNSLADKSHGPGKAFPGAGAQSFVSHCSACHGIDGRGGEHAPGIISGPSARDRSGARLLALLENGIPSAGMPSFRSLGRARLKVIINYIHVLQDSEATSSVAGNPARGRKLFFDVARCSACHMIDGAGGFLGPDLSSYSLLHSPGEIRQAILNPNKNLSPETDTVVAVARDGRKFVGIARNEDNFSLQLQTPDGHLHLFMKSGLVAVHHEPWSLMPSDYRSKLKDADLRDLISFLVTKGSDASQAARQRPLRAERVSRR